MVKRQVKFSLFIKQMQKCITAAMFEGFYLANLSNFSNDHSQSVLFISQGLTLVLRDNKENIIYGPHYSLFELQSKV